MIDENEVEGTIRNVAGKVQDAAGGLTGDETLQAKGKLNQAAGNAQQTFGAAAEEIRDTVKASPLSALAVVGAVCLAIGFLARR
jgi:uncharacterized protein YjbJ (UPF0337 family)